MPPTPPTPPTPADNPHAQTAAMLRAIAGRSLVGTPLVQSASDDQKRAWLDTFADEFGRRLPTQRPLLARLLGIDPGPVPANLAPAAALLWAMHDHTFDPETHLLRAPNPAEPGPLLYDEADDSVAIEWRTLDELTALHALSNLSRAPAQDPAARERWRSRCDAAARWHIAELQPDNATNHPWGIHVFYELAAKETDPTAAASARFHAETLLHNCQVQQGRPDLVSACILLDAARTLETRGI